MGNKVTVLMQITGSGGPGRQQYERNIDTGSSHCAPGGTGRELARKEASVSHQAEFERGGWQGRMLPGG